MKKTIVISLGGSLIVPNRIDTRYLKEFAKTINNLKKKYKIVVVTGGGITARIYMRAIRYIKKEEPYTSLVGIESTKLNSALVAAYLNQFHMIPNSITEIKKQLQKSSIVVTGAIGFEPNMTSDGDAALIAHRLEAEYFINLTNVNGLYTKNPKRYITAKLIPEISFANFDKLVNKIKFKAGQHFVLDQSASKIIKKYKIKTAIIHGKKLKEISKLLNNRRFTGTIIK